MKLLRTCSDYGGNANIAETYKNMTALVSGTQIELSFMESLRQVFHGYLESHFNDFLESFAIWLHSEYPIAASSSITIERDLQGRLINDFGPSSRTKAMYLTVFPQNGRTWVLFSYLKDDITDYAGLRRDLLAFGAARFKIVLTNLIAIHVENFYVSPTYWEGISKSNKNGFLEKYRSTAISAGEDLSELSPLSIFD